MCRENAARVLIAIAVVLVAASWCEGSIGESEPNGSAATADLLPTGPDGDWGLGNIAASAGDEDWWRVDGAAAGDLLFAHVFFDNPLCPGEPYLYAFANDGVSQLEYVDPDAAAGVVVPQAGSVFLVMHEMGNNEELCYSLAQAVVPASDQGAEIEPNATFAQATVVDHGVLSGSIAGADLDLFAFTVEQSGGWIVAIVDNDPDRNGLSTQTVVDLVDAQGSSIAYRADDYLWPIAIAESFTAPSAGTYYLKVTAGQWTEDDDYRFTLLVNGHTLRSDILFADGFESGSPSAWSSSVP